MIFLNSASSAAALVFYLPGVCTHTDTEGKQRKARVRNILKSWGKTEYLMNTQYMPKFILTHLCYYQIAGLKFLQFGEIDKKRLIRNCLSVDLLLSMP